VTVDDERERYKAEGLDESQLTDDPMPMFDRWFADARASGLYQPEAMVVATVDDLGRPAARMVLLRGHDQRGFCFFTSFESAKAHDLDRQPRVALLFTWNEIWRQVRVVGLAARLGDEESDAYWTGRPRGSQIAATVSRQSAVVADRATLDARFRQFESALGDGAVDRPPTWGGYRVTPQEVEFWQGRENRFHDRLRYRRESGAWVTERLEP
jgi:pyridoxamine 5'-phosphate oxidase